MIVIPVLLVIPELLRTLSRQPSWLSPRLTSTLPQIFGARPKSFNLHLLSGLISSKSMEKQKLPVHQEAAMVVIVVAAEAVVEAEVAVVTVVVAEEEVTEPMISQIGTGRAFFLEGTTGANLRKFVPQINFYYIKK